LLEPPILALDEHRQQLRWLVGALGLRAYFCNPSVLGGRLLVEDEDLVVGHALLGHDDFLTPIDDEVASLVILAVLTSSDSIILTQAVQLAELRPEHYRDLANHHSGRGILSEDLLHLPLPQPGLLVQLVLVPVEFLLRQSDVHEQLRSICEIPHPRLVGVDGTVLVVLLCDAWALVDAGLTELDLPDDEFVGVLGWLV
jgi:hypothetical protein